MKPKTLLLSLVSLLAAVFQVSGAVSIIRGPGVFEATWIVGIDEGALGEVGPGLILSTVTAKGGLDGTYRALNVELTNSAQNTHYIVALGAEDVFPRDDSIGMSFPLYNNDSFWVAQGAIPVGYAGVPVLSFVNPGNGGPITAKLTVGSIQQSGGTALPSGALIQVLHGTTAPSGFLKIGSVQNKFYNLAGHPSEVLWDVYQKK